MPPSWLPNLAVLKVGFYTTGPNGPNGSIWQ
jgi:hypothetical protein